MNQPHLLSGGQKLPGQLTAFIGRRAEMEDITRLLADPACRLLTLLGPGGSGKTRLAIEAAGQQAKYFLEGVCWVDLQPVQAADFLPAAIAGALGLSSHDNPQAQVLDYLQERQLLLVLDNFEHLLAGAAYLTELLRHSTAVKLLLTSREALNLQEEWLYPVPGLPFPPGGIEETEGERSWQAVAAYDAVQLFVERARRLRPGFTPSEQQAGIVRICRLVEGMPLALELAASWTKSLDCTTIAAEIEHSLDFLTAGWRNVPDRHRSMEAVFTYSWGRLTQAEQEVFQQLAVFHDGFRRQAAETVAGATLPLLTALVDKSLLRWEADGRYQMHQLLRQYAAGRIEPPAARQVRERHARYYADFLDRRLADIMGERQLEATEEIAADLENIRAAWLWAAQHGMVEAIGRAVEPLAMFFHIKGRYLEAARLFAEALPYLSGTGEAAQRARALLLSEMGWMAIRLGDTEQAEALFGECRNIYRRHGWRPLPGQATDPRLGLSTLASIRGEYAEAERWGRAGLLAAEEQQHMPNLLTANYQMATVARAQGAYEKAGDYAAAALEIARQMGDGWFSAYCLNEMGRAARALGDYAAARRHFEAGYAARERFADPEGMALTMNNLGDIALRQQQYEEAEALFGRSAAVYRRIHDKGGLAAAYHGLGRTAMARGEYAAARAHFQQALPVAAAIHFKPLLLAILGGVGEFLLLTGRLEAGFRLLNLAAGEPASDDETRRMAQQRLHHYRTQVSPSAARAAQQAPLSEATAAVALAGEALAAALPAATRPGSLSAPRPASDVLVEALTERELEVLQLLAQGKTNRQVAEALSVVPGTVKAHNNRIFSKLGVSNRVQAIARARQLQLIS